MKKICNISVVVLLFTSHIMYSQNKTEHLSEKISLNWELFFDAWISGNAEKCADFFTPDGIHFRPNASIDNGKEEILKSFSQILSASKVEYCKQKTLEIEVFGNKCIEYGTYEQKWVGSKDSYHGSYFAVWILDLDEGLKIYRLIFN